MEGLRFRPGAFFYLEPDRIRITRLRFSLAIPLPKGFSPCLRTPPPPSPRTVQTADRGKLDVRALVLLAILLAAGFILNFTVGKAISGISGGMISPEFIISAFCLTILVVRPNIGQALVIGLISAAVIQITTTSPFVDFAAEGIAAMLMAGIVNAAGKVALAAGNRDGELFFTTDAARTFAKRIVDAGFDGIFVSISNPCDVVCTELWHLTGYDPKKIIGSGCGLDSARLRTEISKKVGVSPKSIDAYMIGEHGFSQLAAFKAATIAGKSLTELQAENPDKYAFDHMEVEELARKGGYVTYQGKQCTEYAVANSAARVCAAVLHNEHAVLSASTLMTGQYGEEGIFTSLPCVIGAEGVEEVYTLDLSEYELEGFHKSCRHIRDNIAQLDWWDAEAYDAK